MALVSAVPPVRNRKVNVAVRLRPLIEREKTEKATIYWVAEPQAITTTANSKQKHAFVFDNVYGPETSTEQIYGEVVAPIVNDAFNGFNGTVLCYGQTSSGKTHTLYGNGTTDQGIIGYCAEEISKRIALSQRGKTVIQLNLIEIYNENVRDLLSSENPIEIIEEGGAVIPKGAEHLDIYTGEDIIKAAKRLQRERRIGETRMNSQSSRSHTILRITINQFESLTGDDEKENASPDDGCGIISAVLNFVDLAGSEKASQTGATGDRLTEARYINTSLTTLSKVVMLLSQQAEKESSRESCSVAHSIVNSIEPRQPKTRLPSTSTYMGYRDSKLTRLLQSSLSGDALIAIICNATPASEDETLSALRFACNAKKIQTKPKRNLISDKLDKPKYERIIQDLQEQLFGKNEELTAIKEELKRALLTNNDDNTGLVFERRKTFHCPPSMRDTWKTMSLIDSDLSSAFRPFTADLKDLKGAWNATCVDLKSDYGQTSKISSRITSDKETQTSSDGPTPAKNFRRDNQTSPSTPVQILRMQRSLLSQTIDDDRTEWSSEKKFIQEELDSAKSEIAELTKTVQTMKDDNLKEMEKLKLKYCAEIESLKQSKEYEVDVLNSQVQKKDSIIKSLKRQLEDFETSSQETKELLALTMNENGELKKLQQQDQSQANSSKIDMEVQTTENLVSEAEIFNLKEQQTAEINALKKSNEEQLNHMKSKNEELLTQVSICGAQLDDKICELGKCNEIVEKLKEDLSLLSTENTELQNAISELKTTVTEKEKAMTENQELAKKYLSENDTLSSEITQLQQRLDNILQEQDELKSTLKHKENTLSDSQVVAEKYLSENESMHREIAELRQQLDNSLEDQDKLQVILEEKDISLKENQELVKKYVSENETLHHDIAELTQQLEHSLQERNEVNKSVESIKHTVEDLKNKLRKQSSIVKVNVESQTHGVEDLEEFLNLKRQHDANIHSLKESYSKDENALKIELEEKYGEISNLNCQIEDIKSKLEAVTKENEIIKTDLNSYNACREEMDIKIADLENILKAKEIVVVEIRTQLESRIKEKESIINEKKELMQKLDSCQLDYDEALRKLNEANAKLEQVSLTKIDTSVQTVENIPKELEFKQLVEQLKELEAIRQKQEGEINELHSQIREKENSLLSYEKMHESTVLDLRKQLDANIQENERIAQEMKLSLQRYHEIDSKLQEAQSNLCEKEEKCFRLEQRLEEYSREKELLLLKEQEELSYVLGIKEKLNKMEEGLVDGDGTDEARDIETTPHCVQVHAEVQTHEDVIQHELDTLKGLYDRELKNLKQSQDELSSLKSQITAKEKLITTLEAQLQDALSEKDKKEHVNVKYTEKLKEDLRSCWKENKDMSDKISELQTLLQAKDNDLMDLNKRLESLTQQQLTKKSVDKVDSEKQKLRCEKEALTEELKDLKTQLTQVQAALTLANAEKDEISTKLDQKIKHVSKVTRSTQTPEENDPIAKYNTLKTHYVILNKKFDSYKKDIVKESNEKDLEIRRLQKSLEEKGTECESLVAYFEKLESHREKEKLNRVDSNIQCDLLNEMFETAKTDKAFQLPPGLPDVRKYKRAISSKTQEVNHYKAALEKCKCEANSAKKRSINVTENTSNSQSKSPAGEPPVKKFVSKLGTSSDRTPSVCARPKKLMTLMTTSPSVFPKNLSIAKTAPELESATGSASSSFTQQPQNNATGCYSDESYHQWLMQNLCSDLNTPVENTAPGSKGQSKKSLLKELKPNVDPLKENNGSEMKRSFTPAGKIELSKVTTKDSNAGSESTPAIGRKTEAESYTDGLNQDNCELEDFQRDYFKWAMNFGNS